MPDKMLHSMLLDLLFHFARRLINVKNEIETSSIAELNIFLSQLLSCSLPQNAVRLIFLLRFQYFKVFYNIYWNSPPHNQERADVYIYIITFSRLSSAAAW